MHHRITGVLCQSARLSSYAYTYTEDIPSDANVTITCLMKVLHDICIVSIIHSENILLNKISVSLI